MQDSKDLRKEAARIVASRESVERWLWETSSLLFIIYMTGDQGEEVRQAAMDAIDALEWLKTPEQRIEIVHKKPPYKRRERGA